MQSISTLQSTTILETTHERAGGFAPKYSRNTWLNDWKSRGSSSHTPQRTTCSALYPASFRTASKFWIAWRDCTMIAGDHFSVDHGHLARHVQPAPGLDRPRERQMLSARAFAAFYAITIYAHPECSSLRTE
jgi:hypothetical protein